MTKMKSKIKVQPLALITSIVGVVLIIGAYFIGYNVGQNATSSPNSSSGGLTGSYSRTYYNNYNHNVTSYITFKDDGSCRYASVATEYGDSIDLSETDTFCSYTYDSSNKSGIVTIDHYKRCVEAVYNSNDNKYLEERLNNCKTDNQDTYNFTYTNDLIRLGTNTYSRMR